MYDLTRDVLWTMEMCCHVISCGVLNTCQNKRFRTLQPLRIFRGFLLKLLTPRVSLSGSFLLLRNWHVVNGICTGSNWVSTGFFSFLPGALTGVAVQILTLDNTNKIEVENLESLENPMRGGLEVDITLSIEILNLKTAPLPLLMEKSPSQHATNWRKY